MSDEVARLVLALDAGTTTWTVAWKWNKSRAVHTLKFSSTYSEKDSEELDATVGRSQGGWHFGSDVRYLNVRKIEHIKLGILGVEPYTMELKEAFKASVKAHGVIETPVTLFENLFKYVLATLEESYQDAPESEEFVQGQCFQDIPKHCWVTYPVRHNDSMRLILFEAALNAGFDRVDGLSEAMSAAHYVAKQAKKRLFTANTTVVIGDCGGGSTLMMTGWLAGNVILYMLTMLQDFVGVSRDHDGLIRQACASDGFNQGGLDVNHAFQEWLYRTFPNNEHLTASRSWPAISSEFDGCKRAFNGMDPVRLDVLGETIHISVEMMASFFKELRDGILRLFWEQYAAAQDQGHVPEVFYLCGGSARNKWFAKSIFDLIKQQKPQMTCETETHVATVALGALSFAEDPIRETSVAGEDVGLTFLMDRSASGMEWRGDRVEEAIGWVIEKGQPAGDGSRVELIKKLYRHRRGAPNQIISSDLYATRKQFDRMRMRSDHDIDWDCRITYPLTGVRSHLEYLGRIEAKIPLDILFPSSMDYMS